LGVKDNLTGAYIPQERETRSIFLGGSMQTKYRNRRRINPDREIKEGRKRKEETVYTKSFGTKQKFGAANKGRSISVEEYLKSTNVP
jgi:hypothetical protein